VSPPSKVDPYRFQPEFEREAVGLSCSNPGFWSRIGHAIDPAALDSEVARLALSAARELDAERGVPVSSPLYVIQHLRRRMNEGKVTQEQVLAVGNYFEVFDDAPTPDLEAVVDQLVVVIRRRVEADAIRASMDLHANRKDMAPVIDLFSRAAQLGKAEQRSGLQLATNALWAEVDTEGVTKCLSTGVGELDDLLGGGLPKRELGLVSLATGGGKSMTMAHFAGQGVWEGCHVAVATTEVSEATWGLRVMANITGVPIDAMTKPGPGRVQAQRLYDSRQGKWGPYKVRYFTPGATTVDDIRRWCRERGVEEGRPVDLLVVDSADDLTIRASKMEIPGHERVKRVYTELRRLIHDELMCWGWTVSQPKGVSSTGPKRKKIGTDDLADGMGKVRVADKLLVAEVDEDQSTIEFHLPKNRTGKARGTTGPMPLDFACAQVGMMVRFAAGRG
jgi:hypothetical protein